MNTFALAVRNVRKSVKDYSVYFLTILIGVTLFYVFNSIEGQAAMMELKGNELAILLGMNRVMSWLSVFISAILGFLILYANNFLIRRRKKELGIYMLLGMKKGKISRVLVIETMLVGIVSLVAGILAGVFLSQWFALLTAYLMGVNISQFAFIFSSAAVIKCVFYFGAAFLLVMLFNTGKIKRQKLIDLIYANRKNERFLQINMGGSVSMFFAGIALLTFAYISALSLGITIFAMGHITFFIIACGIVGTFLFFASLSGFFPRLISRKKRVYFNGLNLFALKQINSKIRTSYISMGFVCLMLFLAITSVSAGSSMASAMRDYYGDGEVNIATSITYIASYIGIIFMVACASVLAITQLSEASDNQERYNLLSKLGASDKMLNAAIFKQVLIYFATPLVLALVHSVVGVTVLSGIINLLTSMNTLAMSLAAGIVILLVYGGYFFMTYKNAKELAKTKC